MYIYTVSLLYCIYVCLYSAVVVSPRLFPHPKRHELLALVAHGHHAHFRCGVLPPMALACRGFQPGNWAKSPSWNGQMGNCWENCWEKVARKSIQNCDWTPQLLERMLQITLLKDGKTTRQSNTAAWWFFRPEVQTRYAMTFLNLTTNISRRRPFSCPDSIEVALPKALHAVNVQAIVLGKLQWPCIRTYLLFRPR